MLNVTTIILTGGAASRMQPLSGHEGKTMIPFLGKPLLFYLISALNKFKFTDIICTSPGQRGEIQNYFGDGKEYGVNLKYYKTEKWSGTAGIVKKLIMDMRDNISDTFMVIYGDSLLRADYEKMLRFHRQKKSQCTILYHRPDYKSFLYDYHDKDESYKKKGERTNYGVMDITSDEQLIYIEEKALLSTITNKFKSPVANATVYLIEKDILGYIPPDRLFDFPQNYFPLLINSGIKCFGFNIETGYRFDIGTLSNYYKTQFDILKGKYEFDFYIPSLKERLWIAESSRDNTIQNLIKPILIGEQCRINSSAKIKCSIIGNNVFIGKFTTIKNSIILDDVYISDNVNISNCIIGENSFIGNDVFLPLYTVLGRSCKLGISNFTEPTRK